MHHAALARMLGILSLGMCVLTFVGGLRDTRFLFAAPLSGLIIGFVGHRLNIRDARDLRLRDEELAAEQSRLPMAGMIGNGLFFVSLAAFPLVVRLIMGSW